MVNESLEISRCGTEARQGMRVKLIELHGYLSQISECGMHRWHAGRSSFYISLCVVHIIVMRRAATRCGPMVDRKISVQLSQQ